MWLYDKIGIFYCFIRSRVSRKFLHRAVNKGCLGYMKRVAMTSGPMGEEVFLF